MERNVVVPFRTLRSHGEHVRAAVDAGDEAVAPDHLQQLGDVEARAAADVEYAVAGLSAERRADQLAPVQHIARRVELLQPLDESPIELQLTHKRDSTARPRIRGQAARARPGPGRKVTLREVRGSPQRSQRRWSSGCPPQPLCTITVGAPAGSG